MRWLLLGSLSFILFFTEDLNDWRLNLRPLRICFPAGIVLLAFSVLNIIAESRAGLSFGRNGYVPEPRQVLFLILSAGFLFLLIHTLFFALPAKEAYVAQDSGRKTCTTGAYALCRHPGVLWLGAFMLCLYLADSFSLPGTVLFSAWNVLLVLFEDRCVFPARLSDYGSYRRRTPFLIPTRASMNDFLFRRK